MKLNILKYVINLLSISLLLTSCVVVDDDDFYIHDDDFLQHGRWYPSSAYGLTDCEYDSYIIFTNSSYYHYDCEGTEDDAGYYYINGSTLEIDFDNGDRESYRIIDLTEYRLELKSISSGRYYRYVKR